MYGKNDSGHHFHFKTQSRFLTIPNITLSSAFHIIYLVSLHDAISIYVDDTKNRDSIQNISDCATTTSEKKYLRCCLPRSNEERVAVEPANVTYPRPCHARDSEFQAKCASIAALLATLVNLHG